MQICVEEASLRASFRRPRLERPHRSSMLFIRSPMLVLGGFLSLALLMLTCLTWIKPLEIQTSGIYTGDSALFTFRFGVSFIGAYIASTWFDSDLLHRRMQPFVGMLSNPEPAVDNILLDYVTTLPGVTTINSFLNGHYKVAWFSALWSLCAPFGIVLTSTLYGVGEKDGDWVVISTSSRQAVTLGAFAVLYIITMPFIWPSRKRRHPRSPKNGLDILLLLLFEPCYSRSNALCAAT